VRPAGVRRRALRVLRLNGTPLAYSLPGFTTEAYFEADRWLDALRDLGFSWVTFHPTFPVEDEIPLRIGPGPELGDAVQYARSLGFSIRLEPHLDFISTLRGGPYEWRRRMYVDPMRQYFDDVLAPMAILRPDELTLGSELDVSAYEFGDAWAEVAERLRPTGIALGHKLNHDWKTTRRVIRREVNIERAARGLQPRWPILFGRRLHPYLASLDYVAVSYYPAGVWDLEERYVIGEFGLGSTDLSRPWHFDQSTFQTPEDLLVRRGYYLRFLEWLTTRTGRAACFWTAGHFDVLGIMHPEWRDDVVTEAVDRYNGMSQT
jgi:hypothetical protein